MSQAIQILTTVLPVVLTIAIGMLCRRTKLLSREGVAALKAVAVNITLPAVMLNAFASLNYTGKNVLITLTMFAVCLAAWLLGRALQGVVRLPGRFTPFLTTGFEAGMLGYALFMLLYGADRVGDFACVDLGQVLFVFTLYKVLLGLNGGEKVTAGRLLDEMRRSPTVIAIVAGVLLGATGLYRAMAPSGLQGLLNACTDFVSAPTSCVILIAIGYDLVPREIPWRDVGRTLALRVVVMAALRVVTGLALAAMGIEGLGPALNIMFILPAPYVLPVFADDERERASVSSTLSAMTLLTVVAFVVLAAVARG